MVDHSSWDTKAPLVIAHRGASSLAPENTLAAFRLAVELGVDGIELDAKLSSDGIVVVHHDQTLERTTSGSGLVRAKKNSELRKLDAGSKFNDAFRGERIPTLDEVFTEVGHSILINVELTNYGTVFDLLVKEVASLVARHQLEEQVLLSSFNPIAIWQASRALPGVRRALLIHGSSPRIFRNIFMSCLPVDDVHPAVQLVDQGWVERQHSRDRRVRAWTVNEPERIQSLLEMGVDGVITDTPDLAIRVRQGVKRSRA